MQANRRRGICLVIIIPLFLSLSFIFTFVARHYKLSSITSITQKPEKTHSLIDRLGLPNKPTNSIRI